MERPTPGLQLLRLDHAPPLLAFERANRAYFAASVPDRGDEFFAEFDTRHAQLLAWQAAGTGYLHVLVTERGEVVGRVNLTDVADGAAELGYRIAQKAAGQGLAIAAVRQVREHVHLLFLPPYSPELQPAEHLWSLTNAVLINQHFST